MSQTKATTIEVYPSTVQTTAGGADKFDPSDHDEMLLYIKVTAVSGTSPTLDLIYYSSPDNSTFHFHAAASQITAIGDYLLNIPNNIGKHVQLFWGIGGTTPALTVEVKAVMKKRW